MSFNGTVYCSYCGSKGHNKLGCPVRKSHASVCPKLALELEHERQARLTSTANRRCTYCDEKDHNRASCPTLKRDKESVSRAQVAYLRDFNRNIATSGLLPGALLKVPRGRFDDPYSRGVLVLLTNVCWDNVDFLAKLKPPEVSWRIENDAIFKSKIISTWGYSSGDMSEHLIPRKEDTVWIRPRQVTRFVAGSVAEPTGHNLGDHTHAELVGPVYTERWPRTLDAPQALTDRVEQFFKFKVDKGAKRRHKVRYNDQSAWERIEKESQMCEEMR